MLLEFGIFHHMQPSKPALPTRCASCRIRSIGLCSALSAEERSRLSGMATHRAFAAGQTIRMEGEPISFYGNVIDGVAKKVKSTADGRQQIVGLLFGGDLLDQMFFDHAPYTIEAVSELSLCSYPKSGFEAMVRDDPSLEHRLLHQVTKELNEAQEWMLLLGRKTARERVASFLLMLARRGAKLNCPHGEGGDAPTANPAPDSIVVIPVSRSVMADYLGLTTETVCRQMTNLRHDSIIRLPDNHSFELVDHCGLQHAAGE
jgi:CRP/FNR family transcriptional regulator